MVRYFGRATGQVQGVGFRFFVQANAADLGLTGWVKNMRDGSVTMEIQGPEDKVEEIEKRIRAGNRFIRVESLILEERSLINDECDFGIHT